MQSSRETCKTSECVVISTGLVARPEANKRLVHTTEGACCSKLTLVFPQFTQPDMHPVPTPIYEYIV